jgi:membrane protease YdiL (CAAX protease family)
MNRSNAEEILKVTKENWIERIWRLITPELVYLGICYLIEIACGIYWAFSMMDEFVTDDLTNINTEAFTAALTEMITKYAVLLQTVSAVIAIFFLLRMYRKDYKRRRFVFDKSKIGVPHWLLIIPAGIFASLAGNLIMNISDIASMSESYQEAEVLLFSGPFAIQVIGIGIVIPICEELVYRGLIYMRMRQYLNVNMSILVSALIFGLVHGNPVQGIYGFLVGILFAYVYEQYGSLKAPMLAHVSANMLSLLLMVLNPDLGNAVMVTVGGILAVVLTLAMVLAIDRKVEAKRIYLEA